MEKKVYVIIVCILLAACSKNTEVENNILLGFSESSINAQPGDLIEISIIFENCPEPIFGMSFQIEYDNSIISFVDSTGVIQGDYFSENSLSFCNEAEGVIHLAFTQVQGEEMITGSGIIGKIYFHVLTSGSTQMEIINSSLHFYDAGGNEVDIPDLILSNCEININ